MTLVLSWRGHHGLVTSLYLQLSTLLLSGVSTYTSLSTPQYPSWVSLSPAYTVVSKLLSSLHQWEIRTERQPG